MRIKLFLTLLLFSTYGVAGSIKVTVASNVSYAMDALKKEFTGLHPDIRVQITLGSSGKLTAQIKNGAPYELFMSANMMYPEALYKEGFATTKPLVYAQGSLAYLSYKKQDFSTGMALLKSDTITKIALANPKTAPYGKAAKEAMVGAGIYESVKRKYIYAESISQTVTYTITAADIGFIAKSSLYSPKMAHFKEGIHWADVNSSLYTPINQGLVILKAGEKRAEVKAFYDYLLSKKAQRVFRDFGYRIP
ncbi:MAG: molybdate ABC transporter substrate-binding protein [Campylobacterota bacterium]|nr:molybdate ABC transporter substrate-binding protein [Campylobacterota bacterium]